MVNIEKIQMDNSFNLELCFLHFLEPWIYPIYSIFYYCRLFWRNKNLRIYSEKGKKSYLIISYLPEVSINNYPEGCEKINELIKNNGKPKLGNPSHFFFKRVILYNGMHHLNLLGSSSRTIVTGNQIFYALNVEY